MSRPDVYNGNHASAWRGYADELEAEVAKLKAEAHMQKQCAETSYQNALAFLMELTNIKTLAQAVVAERGRFTNWAVSQTNAIRAVDALAEALLLLDLGKALESNDE